MYSDMSLMLNITYLLFPVAKLQILFELWRVLTGNVADTAKIISIRTFGDVG